MSRRLEIAGIVALAVLASAPAPTFGQSVVSLRAEVGSDTRIFPDAPLFGQQGGSRVSPSLVFRPELEWQSSGGAWRLTSEGFARLDAHDDNRSHVDLREFGVEYLGDSFLAFVGFGQVFWGVTEARHLVDVVNQIDGVEDLDGEDKLGQPMVAVTLEGGWGALDLYYLPYFRERSFPAGDARLRGSVPVEPDALYTSDQGRWHPGFAARAFRTQGAVDVGLSFFRGTSREPRFQVVGVEGSPGLQPLYDQINQVGLDAQWTGEGTLLKLEAITRGGHDERFYALAGGVEHTLYQFLGSDSDLGLIGELTLDSRSEAAPPTLFDQDVFLGGRWAWNDVSDTSVLGGPLVDLDSGEVLLLLEADRRIGSVWRASADIRLFANTVPGSLVHGMRNDGYLSFAITRFF